MPRKNNNTDFAYLFENRDSNTQGKLFEIFSEQNLQNDFILFLEKQIDRGKAKKVIDFIEENKLHGTFPQLIETLAYAYEKNGDTLNAAKTYETLADISPDSGEISFNLSKYYFKAKEYNLAEKYALKTLTLKNNRPETLFLLGDIYRMTNRFDLALEKYREALRFDFTPRHILLYNIAVIYEKLFDYDSALTYYEQSLSENPDDVLSHWNKSLILLRKGNYSRGWKEFEWRKKKKEYPKYLSMLVECDAEKLRSAKKILLFTEQGFGDAIQFIRFIPLLKTSGEKAIIVKKELRRLFELSGYFDKVYEQNEAVPEKYDCSIPLLSLPFIFNADKVALERPVWKCNETREEKNNDLKIGIVWKGNPLHENDKFRSVDLGILLKTLSGKNIKLYSLQVGNKTATEQMLLSEFNVRDLSNEIGDFFDTAKKLCELDALVTVDTAIAHLSGSMFKPTFVLLPKNSDWRWGESDVRNAWYPSVKTFRQSVLGNWEEPLKKLRSELKNKIATKNSGRNASSVFELAQQLDSNGEHEKALQILKNEYEKGDKTPEMLFNLGLAYHKIGNLEEAEKFYRKIIPFTKSEEVYYNLILLLIQKNETNNEAEKIVAEAAALYEKSAKINFIAGNFYKARENFDNALLFYEKALALRADYRSAKLNIASVYFILGKIEEAEHYYNELLKSSPKDAEARYNIALIYLEKKEYYRALKEINTALSLKEDARFRLAKAEILLTTGNLDEGLKEYEYRLHLNPPLIKPEMPLATDIPSGKKILIFEEQGIGDTIHFLRFVKILSQKNETIFAARPSLVGFLKKQKFLDKVISINEAQNYDADYKIPVVSLFKLFYEKNKSLPQFEKYLTTGKNVPGEKNKPKIAFAWRGNPYPPHQRKRHLNVALFENILTEINAEFYPLQQNPTNDETNFFSKFDNVIYDKTFFKTFSDLADLINGVDIVISIDSVYAHLAGGLNKKTYVLLHYSPDWRWGDKANTTAWYPSLTLLRQQKYGNWKSVMQQLLHELKNHL